MDSAARRAQRAAYDAQFAQARMRTIANVQRALSQPRAVAVAVEQLSATKRHRRGNWTAWIVVSVGSAALVTAGYLGALVQLGVPDARHPHPIQQSFPPEPDSNALPTTVRIAPAPAAIAESARTAAPARRLKAHGVDTKAAALATAELEREVYRRQAPVLTIRSLSKPERQFRGGVQPSRADVQQALLALRPRLEECAAGRHGRVDARVGIAGSGFVTSALIQGDFAGTKEGSCMARALRAAAVPPFSGPVVQVQFPFAL